MEKTPDFRENISKAKKEIELASHLAYVTYNAVKETKFLLAISKHIVNSAHLAIEALLDFEHYYKRIEAFHRSFPTEIMAYKYKVEGRYALDPKFFRLFQKLIEIQKFDEASVSRFKHGDRYILASDDFSMSVLDIDSIKRYLNLAKKFIEQVDTIIQNESKI